MQELADKVWSNRAFHDAAGAIQRAWIARETGHDPDPLPPLITVAKVVRASAILACSSNRDHREKAYRAATSAFELYGDDQLPLDQATRVVLGRLGNFPAMLTRAAIADARVSMPLRLVSEEMVRSDGQTIVLREKPVVLTDFQHRLWTKLVGRTRLAISAPTSAGKSFVLQSFVALRLEHPDPCSVIYLVPTRALIAQVSRDLRGMVGARVAGKPSIEIVTVPLEGDVALPSRAIFVMTQERLQLMLNAHPSFSGEVIVIDEAHSIAEGSRGVLLQWVIEDLLRRRLDAQLLFASPAIRNLEVFGRLFGLHDIESLPSYEPTVGQNFLPVTIDDPLAGKVTLHLAERESVRSVIAYREFGRRTVTRVEKLVNTCLAFGVDATNIVYANGAGDAENLALALVARLAEREVTAERDALARLVAEAVHQSYALVDCVRRGVAFHYSTIPTQVRQAIEKAVADGVIDYLVCTSTLLQGVNLPAKNVFMCRPEKGQFVPLESVDFWNLAGRAGRLLKEFQGNIFLIDYDQWRKKPLTQERETDIVPAIEAGMLDRGRDLLRLIEQPGSQNDTELEAVFVRLLDDLAGGTLDGVLQRLREEYALPSDATMPLREALAAAATRITIPRAVLRQNPDISAYKQQQLYDALLTRAAMSPQAARALLPKHPREEGAYESYATVLELCHRTILRLKPESRFHRFMALLSLWWMEGRPLPRIIQNQIDRNRDKDRRLVVRDTLELVEREVRYQCVRLFSCYNSILIQVLDDVDQPQVRLAVPPLPLFLEVGASDRTMISLISLGLSRVVAMRLAPLAPTRDLDTEAARSWLRFRSLESLNLPTQIQEEIRTILAGYDAGPALR